jgi:hypothetical protein
MEDSISILIWDQTYKSRNKKSLKPTSEPVHSVKRPAGRRPVGRRPRKRMSRENFIALEEDSVDTVYEVGVPSSQAAINRKLHASFKRNHSEETYQKIAILDK